MLTYADVCETTDPTALPGTHFVLPVGSKLEIQVTAAAALVGKVEIGLLANPGAPMHSLLTSTTGAYADVC
jgi:hypothetical protein